MTMPLRAIADELWEVEDRIRMPGGVSFPLRMTIARLPGRQLWLHSPVRLDDATAAAIDALGDVAHVVAPNLYHHLHLPAAATRWPAARTWAPPGLDAKRKEPHLRLERLDEATPPPWADAIDLVRVGGAPKLHETAFFHRASRSMLCADLMFHVTEPANARTRFVLWLVGAGGGRLASSRVWSGLIKDRAAARASLQRILAWDVGRVIPAHGAIVDDPGVRAALPRAMRRIAGKPALAAATV
jgi:hypothetical protein